MRIPDFLKPGRGLGSFSPMGLVLVFGILTIGLASEYGLVSFEEDLELKVSGEVGVQSGDTIPLQVQVQLINNTDNEMALTAPTPCKVFKWVLVDSRRDFVQAKLDEVCPQVMMQGSLPANSNTTEAFVLEIDATRLRPDTSYELRVSYWGTMGTLPVDFVFDLPG